MQYVSLNRIHLKESVGGGATIKRRAATFSLFGIIQNIKFISWLFTPLHIYAVMSTFIGAL